MSKKDSQPAKQKKKEKTRNLSSLLEISKVLGASFDLDRMLNVILDTMLRQTDSDSGSLMLLDETGRHLTIRASRGIKESIVHKVKVNLGEGIAGIVAKTKKPLLIDNKNFYSIFKKRPRHGVKSSLSIPLCFGNRLFGVINLNRIPGSAEFQEEDLKIISDFAQECTIAINNAKLYIDAEEKIQHLFRFNVISCALNAALSREKLVDVLTDCMSELFIFDFYTLLLIEENNYFIIVGTQNKLSSQAVAYLKQTLALVVSGLKKKTIFPNKLQLSIKDIKTHLLPMKGIITPSKINSVLHTPLITKGNALGMLSLYSVRDNAFSQKDQQSLTTLANQTAVALENTNLYRSLRKTYLSTIKALAQAIEEKDDYTRGHSDLVSSYSVAIAEAMELPQKLVEGIQIAGILHDIGKIGIPENILTKPSSLTIEEYEIIKNHPIIGKRILEPVDFYWVESPNEEPQETGGKNKKIRINLDRHMINRFKSPLDATIDILRTTNLSDEIKNMIYHHHEKYGGGGYPDGVAGENIPIGSRILAVADTFEAMTADRPYRKAFPVKKALGLMLELAPKQLDPKIVEIFVKLIRKNLIQLK